MAGGEYGFSNGVEWVVSVGYWNLMDDCERNVWPGGGNKNAASEIPGSLSERKWHPIAVILLLGDTRALSSS